MMRNNELKALIKKQEPTFLQLAKHKGYVCPECGNGSGRDGDGISRSPGSDSFHCFKCEMTDDVIGLYGRKFGIADFREMLKGAANYYSISTGEVITPPPTRVQTREEEAQEEEKVDQTENFRKWNTALNSSENLGLAYMQSRGLSLKTLNAFHVGFAQAWKHPKTEHLSKVPSSPRVIIPTSRYSYLARDVRDVKDIPEAAKRFTKSKFGRVSIFNKSTFRKTEDLIFVVEGEIDAMSVYECGFSAIGLGSASNKRALVSLVKEIRPKATLVFLPDNDEAGQKSAKDIVTELKELGVEAYIANIFEPYKDANEMLVKDKETLTRNLGDLAKRATMQPAKRASLKDVDAVCRELVKHLNLHPRHREYLKSKGLTDEQIEKNCYRSAPSDPVSVCRSIKRSGCATEGNPMFTQKDNGDLTLSGLGSGILVPERTTKGMFQGFEVLRDRNTRDMHHPHFRRGERCIGEAVLTDSALKADVISALSGYATLAIPAGASEELMRLALSSIQKRGMEKLLISYDLWQKAATVNADKEHLKRVIKSLGLTAKGMQKIEGMELDEFLLSNKPNQDE